MSNKTRVKGVNTGGITLPSCDSETAGVLMTRPSLSPLTFVKIGEFNLKSAYNTPPDGEFNIVYSGSFWYLMGGYGSQELAFANPGNENYPWEATWPVGYSVTKQC